MLVYSAQPLCGESWNDLFMKVKKWKQILLFQGLFIVNVCRKLEALLGV